MDVLSIANASLRNNSILFRSNSALPDYLKTKINMVGCVFNHSGSLELVTNSVDNKEIVVRTSASVELGEGFSARVVPGTGRITVESDLTGL